MTVSTVADGMPANTFTTRIKWPASFAALPLNSTNTRTVGNTPKSLLSIPVDAWTEQDWMDLYSAMEWVKQRVCERHGITCHVASRSNPKPATDCASGSGTSERAAAHCS